MVYAQPPDQHADKGSHAAALRPWGVVLLRLLDLYLDEGVWECLQQAPPSASLPAVEEGGQEGSPFPDASRQRQALLLFLLRWLTPPSDAGLGVPPPSVSLAGFEAPRPPGRRELLALLAQIEGWEGQEELSELVSLFTAQVGTLRLHLGGPLASRRIRLMEFQRITHITLRQINSNCQSPDALVADISLFKGYLTQADANEMLVDPESVFGRHIRACCLALEGMEFPELVQLFDDLQQWWQEGGDVPGMSEDVSGHPDLMAQHFELLLREAGAPLPGELSEQLQSWLAHQPPGRCNSYLRHLEHARAGDFQLALDHLLRFGDESQAALGTSGPSGDILPASGAAAAGPPLLGSRQFNLICLASLHLRFGHEDMAHLYLQEAVPVARDAGDAASLYFLQSWLSRFPRPHQGPPRAKEMGGAHAPSASMMQRLLQGYNRGTSSNHPRLSTAPVGGQAPPGCQAITALNHLERAHTGLEQGRHPRTVFEAILMAGALDPGSDKVPLLRGRAWEVYGNVALAQAYARMAEQRRVRAEGVEAADALGLQPSATWPKPAPGNRVAMSFARAHMRLAAHREEGITLASLDALLGVAISLLRSQHRGRGHLVALPYVLSCLCLAERLYAAHVEDFALVLMSQILLSLGSVAHALALMHALLPRMLGRGHASPPPAVAGQSPPGGHQGWRATALAEAWLTLAQCVTARPSPPAPGATAGHLTQALAHVERAEAQYRRWGEVEGLQRALSWKARLYHALGAVPLRNAAAREVRQLEEATCPTC